VNVHALETALETLLDVCLPDGAMGTVGGYERRSGKVTMVTVTGSCGGLWFTRRVPATAVEPSVRLRRMIERG